MTEAWFELVPELYAWTYFGLVVALVFVEWFLPWRRSGSELGVRWANNVAATVLNTYVARWVAPAGAVGWAVVCRDRGWGVLNYWHVPTWLEVVLVVVAIDLARFVQHRLLHASDLLWRIHRTHHSDPECDFTTGLRFHPLEAALTMVVLLAAVTLTGASPLSVVAAELVVVGSTFLTHANIRVSPGVDRVLRTIFVTPAMHRRHHSQQTAENRSNLAITFSFWDRLCGTYRPPVGDDEPIVFGLGEFAGRKHLTLHWMLAQPFLGEANQTVPSASHGTSCSSTRSA